MLLTDGAGNLATIDFQRFHSSHLSVLIVTSAPSSITISTVEPFLICRQLVPRYTFGSGMHPSMNMVLGRSSFFKILMASSLSIHSPSLEFFPWLPLVAGLFVVDVLSLTFLGFRRLPANLTEFARIIVPPVMFAVQAYFFYRWDFVHRGSLFSLKIVPRFDGICDSRIIGHHRELTGVAFQIMSVTVVLESRVLRSAHRTSLGVGCGAVLFDFRFSFILGFPYHLNHFLILF